MLVLPVSQTATLRPTTQQSVASRGVRGDGGRRVRHPTTLNWAGPLPISGVAMKTSSAVPAISTLVEMTGSGAPVRDVRIDAAQPGVLTLSLPRAAAAALPAPGEPVVLRWPAGPRGRYALAGRVVDGPDPAAATDPRITVRTDGDPQIEQDRNFVRGGGGEQVRVEVAGSAEVGGWIFDISERGLRAQFAEAAIRDGDPLLMHVHLGTDTVHVVGTALKVSHLPSGPDTGPMRVELVAVFAADEVQAQVIRRYVLHQQLLTRVRTAGD